VQPYMIFEHFCHQTVDPAAGVCKQHKDVCTIISRGIFRSGKVVHRPITIRLTGSSNHEREAGSDD
jgi:hypothetical protein